MTLAPGAELELAIERLAAGGDGVAHSDGLTVFVPRSAPGDRLRVRVSEARPRFARAELVEILSPGPARRAAPCPYYGRCGGCSWLHLDEAEQLRARVGIARAALERIARRAQLPEIEVVASPRALGYRARARVAHAGERVGFRARASHDVVDVATCAVLDPATQAELTRLRESRLSGEGEIEIRGVGASVELAGKRLEIGPGAFFQANRSLWERWQAVVLEACGAGGLAIELYCGVGFYTVGLAQRFARVVAVERSPAAAASAARNAAAEVLTDAAEHWAPRNLGRLAPELVLLNPPRVGCHQTVSDAIAACGAERIVYVSCEPATLARDLARIGLGFRIARLVLLDALPQTHHVELVAVLECN
ncbi:MAG: class I SAM-dependent RNA methyltransferase [Myxococcota bacterium]